MFRIQSLVSKFYQDVNSLDDAKVIAKWNFQKGYEITGLLTGSKVIRYEHFCFQCRKCETCSHLFSEHDNDHKDRCFELKCKCKGFKG
jgi:hypothetical protein